jgi:hypothetical protein
MRAMRPGRERVLAKVVAAAVAIMASAGMATTAMATTAATADTTHLELEWNAPSTCPTRQAVLDEVAHTLGSARAASDAPVVRVDVSREATATTDRYLATLRMTSGAQVHERRMEADDCAAVASAAALIMALAVEGILPATPPTPRPLQRRSPATPPAPVEPKVAPRLTKPWRSRLVVSAAALADTATLPAVALGADVAVGWNGAHGALHVGVSAHGAFFPSRFGGVDDTGGRFDLLEGQLRGCAGYAWPLVGALEVGPCLGLGVDHMSGSGRGSPVSLTGSGSWASALGGALASWSLSRWLVVEGLVGAAVPLARPTFVLDSPASATAPATSSAVHRPAPVSARFGIGLQLRFF